MSCGLVPAVVPPFHQISYVRMSEPPLDEEGSQSRVIFESTGVTVVALIRFSGTVGTLAEMTFERVPLAAELPIAFTEIT